MIRYTIDTAHSNVEFSIRHLVIARVRGRFTRFEGALELDPTDIRSADFFDADTYPRMTFASKHVEAVQATAQAAA